VHVFLPKVGTKRGSGWLTSSFRSDAKKHEKKHVKVWKHYGQVWSQFEEWQSGQAETGERGECEAKLKHRIAVCKAKASSLFSSKTTAAHAGHTAETSSVVSGWIPSRWVGGPGWPWQTRANVWVVTGTWTLNLESVSLECD
jgi:hypothetical protein